MKCTYQDHFFKSVGKFSTFHLGRQTSGMIKKFLNSKQSTEWKCLSDDKLPNFKQYRNSWFVMNYTNHISFRIVCRLSPFRMGHKHPKWRQTVCFFFENQQIFVSYGNNFLRSTSQSKKM